MRRRPGPRAGVQKRRRRPRARHNRAASTFEPGEKMRAATNARPRALFLLLLLCGVCAASVRGRYLAGDSSDKDRDRDSSSRERDSSDGKGGDSSDGDRGGDRDSSGGRDGGRDSSAGQGRRRDSSAGQGRRRNSSAGQGRGDSSSSGRSAENEDPTSDGADSSGNLEDHRCAGRGSAYCRTEFAAEAKTCPRACRRGQCERSGRSAHSSALRSGVYDFAYVMGDLFCVRKCDGKGACVDWDRSKGKPFCKAIRCEEATLDACHGSDDFDRPTCEDCAWLFPNACGDVASVERELAESSGADDGAGYDRFRAYMLKGPLWREAGEPDKPPQAYVADAVRVGVLSANRTLVANLTVDLDLVPAPP
jgi:hypothetical protein